MGTDNLFHKRKARKDKEQARRKAHRKPYDRVLIVCEGEKTEPYYFEEIKGVYALSSANIKIDGSCGSSPISVVQHAEDLFREEKRIKNPFDRVFCVFDRDTHSTFDQALEKIDVLNQHHSTKNLPNIFEAIISIPSFEYWLLLHFNPTTKPYMRTGDHSAGDLVIKDLKQFIPAYEKKQKGIFKRSLTDETLDFALNTSKRIWEAAQRSGDINPSTNIHELVEYLIDLKK